MFTASSWFKFTALLLALGFHAGPLAAQEKTADGWISLFNGKDLTGWKLKQDKYTVTLFVDVKGETIKGAKEIKVDQNVSVQDAKGKPIVGAKVVKDVAVDADGKPIARAKVVKSGGRNVIVDAKGAELPNAKKVLQVVDNPTGGWKVEQGGELTCGLGPKGSDLFTELKFRDFDLHVEFLGTSNSGVYLQGRYEIQIDNSLNVKPKIEEVNGKKVEVLSKTMCGTLYGQIRRAGTCRRSRPNGRPSTSPSPLRVRKTASSPTRPALQSCGTANG